jgi:hypothetical protein
MWWRSTRRARSSTKVRVLLAMHGSDGGCSAGQPRSPFPGPLLRLVSARAVSRLVCKSENYEMDMTLDVNVELLPVEKEFKFSVELATTLNLDGTPDKGCYEQGQEKDAGNRLAGCDYAMHGKVFKYDNMSANKV